MSHEARLIEVVGKREFTALLVSCLMLWSCLPASHASGSPDTTEASPDALAERDVITEVEIDAIDYQSAYEVVQALRPQWLRSRGATSFVDPTPAYAEVFLDGTWAGELAYLWRVSAINVKELRFWGPDRAGIRFGMGYPRGVIEIVSKGIPQ